MTSVRWITCALVFASASVALGQVPWGFNDKQPAIRMQQSAKSGERTYTVLQGDSLWSIAQGLYNEPWYWPSLWSYNPQITNPHLIYPGDVIYLSRRASPIGKRRAVTFATSRFKRRKVTPTTLARRVGYISARDYRESGKIVGSREERNMLGSLDEIYTRLRLKRCSAQKRTSIRDAARGAGKKDKKVGVLGPCVKSGDRFVVYRLERPVVHPTTRKTVGYKINFVGEAEVINTKRPVVGMLLNKAHSEISRGDLLTNVFEPLSLVKPKKNKTQLVGTLVDFHHETTATGQHSYVYIDKGADDGVVRGNRFEIVWRGDGLRGTSVKRVQDWPDEQIGIAMVIESYDRHCLAYLTHSVRELERGMAAVMPKNF
ncbi:MAG: LysM peptidoglycan-binding domain-containing protein [Myxococcales bacterium]|nr:LysM peptidoglycan-binding domain-containing protein [Myxococcales bacterium]